MSTRPQIGTLAGLLLFFAATMAAGLVGFAALFLTGGQS